MIDSAEALARVEELRRQIAEISSQLSELDVMLEDYQAERTTLIHKLRQLQAQLADLEEHLRFNK